MVFELAEEGSGEHCLGGGAVPYAVLPAWIGSGNGTYNIFMTPAGSRHLIAFLCGQVAAVVGGLYQGYGINEKGVFSLVDDTKTESRYQRIQCAVRRRRR